MTDYEAMVILNPALDEEKMNEMISRFEKLIQKNKSEMQKVDRWGKRKLSYPIKKVDSGYYVVFYFKGEEAGVKELNRVFQISDEVVRHKIIKSGT
ncbi:MAG: 30S ribosomal protein S6 [Actinomycetota bacterium]